MKMLYRAPFRVPITNNLSLINILSNEVHASPLLGNEGM